MVLLADWQHTVCIMALVVIKVSTAIHTCVEHDVQSTSFRLSGLLRGAAMINMHVGVSQACSSIQCCMQPLTYVSVLLSGVAGAE